MHEAVLVREREPVGDRDHELERAARRHPAGARDELFEVLALDVLEDDVLPPAVVAAVDDRDDVRVRQLRDRPRLAAEALDVLRVLEVALVEDLDRDEAVELPVVRAKDRRHPACAHELLELVAIGDQVARLRRPRHGATGRPASRHTA